MKIYHGGTMENQGRDKAGIQNGNKEISIEDEVVKHFEAGFRILSRKISTVIIQEFQRQAMMGPKDKSQPLTSVSEPIVESKKLTYSVGEAAGLLGLSRPAAYQAIRRKQIPSIRFGRRIIIPRHALEKMLDEVIH
jgi:excisionase family DNA binding protein